MTITRLMLTLIALLCSVRIGYAQDQTRSDLIHLLAAHLHPDDYAIVEANLDALSDDALQQIYRFMTDSDVITDSAWFDVSAYASWDDYNFSRPADVQVMTLLGRRDLFLDPARQLNNPALTNMSDAALAALTFSQVYVEETWDQEPPWDGDANTQFNWVHSDLLETPSLGQYLFGDYIYKKRMGYWYATYWSAVLTLLHYQGASNGADEQILFDQLGFQAPRLAGHSYPIGNQLYVGTAETVYWFTDYLSVGNARYGGVAPHQWDTTIPFEYPTRALLIDNADENALLWSIFTAPFARKLRIELTHPETASFWNTMRYLHAAARQREGGASEAYPGNGQPGVIALRYDERTAEPFGRPTADVSAFAIITTVYSDSILLDFTNWNMGHNMLLITPTDTDRADGLHRMVSERNKAILVVEHLADEAVYPNATHVSGSRGLGLRLVNQYDDPDSGDFLPYIPDEAYALVMALVVEARDYQIAASRYTLCNSPLLKQGYEAYTARENAALTWSEIVGGLCSM